MLSMIGVTMAVVQVPAGYLSDHFGSRPLIRAALILGVISAVIMAAARTSSIFIVGLIAYGVTSFIGAPFNNYITSMRGNWSVQRAVTFVSGSMPGGWIGQRSGLSSVFQYSAELFLVSTLVTFLARQPEERQAQETAVPIVSPLGNPRFMGLLVIIFFTIFGLSMPQQLTSIYLQEMHHLSFQQIGTTGTLAGVGTAAIMFALGSLRASTGTIVGHLKSARRS